MALILCIDTAGDTATTALSDGNEVIASASNTDQKNHASFIQPAIRQILNSASASFNDIQAVSVVNGPGSYTGLRVGSATAKGICYAIDKPLILLNTLTIMASAAIDYFPNADMLYCPLIDARRNEVFTAVYDFNLRALMVPQPLILEAGSFNTFLYEHRVLFFGSGHNKCGKIIRHENAVFEDIQYSERHISRLSQKAYEIKDFAQLAYSEPFYTKEFFSPVY